MRKKSLSFLLFVCIITSLRAATETQRIYIEEAPCFIRPGKAERLLITSTVEGFGTLSLRDSSNSIITVIASDLQIYPGNNQIIWNGFDNNMQAIQTGEYLFVFQIGEECAIKEVQIGEPAPQITQLLIQDTRVIPGQDWMMSVNVNMPGKLVVVFHVADKHYEIFRSNIAQGDTLITWNGLTLGEAPPSGTHSLSIVFLDESGYPANQQQLILEVSESPQDLTDTNQEDLYSNTEDSQQNAQTNIDLAEDQQNGYNGYSREIQYSVPTREEVSEAELGKDFWRLPVGKYDEESIWKVMMQDITVLWGKDQKDTYKLRATRDASMKRDNIVGEVGYESQGVHIIEQFEDGWSLVEVYNSSYGPDNRTRRGYGNTDDLIRGYVETSALKVITPREDYGILIDKLKQRMYIFKEGKIFTELLISTGIPTRQQPWNETPSGEFLMVSRVGDFTTGNLVCRMALRVNGGALIHEVPYIVNESTGYWDYSSQESQLGKKASHGCIRVQRLNNNDGINMSWLWNNIKVNTKVLIWDDDHRFYEYPDEELALYFNPDGGKYYHLDQNCKSIKSRYLPLKGEMLYKELDSEPYEKLTPCKHCKPPLRFSEIERLNTQNGF